jgi:hypothetical protein
MDLLVTKEQLGPVRAIAERHLDTPANRELLDNLSGELAHDTNAALSLVVLPSFGRRTGTPFRSGAEGWRNAQGSRALRADRSASVAVRGAGRASLAFSVAFRLRPVRKLAAVRFRIRPGHHQRQEQLA